MLIENLLIWLGAVVLLIILAYRFRKTLKLALVGGVYGKYSYEYLSTYKRFYIKSPFQYCIKDDFIAHIIYMLAKKENVPTFKSQHEIHFEKTPYFTRYRDFLKERGNPYCFNAFHFNQVGFEIKALGYKSTIAGSKAVLIFYFLNDSFFMGEYIFKKPKTDIKANIAGLFLETNDLEEDNFYIENTKNRIIHFHNSGFTVDVKFLNREDEAVINKLTEYYNLVTGKKLTSNP